jgi:hypothetical protein
MALEAMALAAMPLEELPLEALSREATDEQQQHTAGKPSPVDVVVNILMAEFQRTSSKQALRDAMREALQASLLQAVRRPGTDPTGDGDPVMEHLQDRGLIPPAPSRASRIKASTASNSAKTTAGHSKRRRASFP